MQKSIYLPLTQNSFVTVLEEKNAFQQRLRELSCDELLGLAALQAVPELAAEPHGADVLERILAQTFTAQDLARQQGVYEVFRDGLIAGLDYDKVQAGARGMFQLNLRFVHRESVENRSYLTPEGEWDFSFAEQEQGALYSNSYYIKPGYSSFMLTEEEIRIVSTIAGENDNQVNIQGYAGCGKTYLIGAILETFRARGIEPKNVLLLAYTSAQLYALKSKFSEAYHAYTFGNLANLIIPSDYRRRTGKGEANKYFDEQFFAEEFKIYPIATYSRQQLVNMIFQTVKNFCLSVDRVISELHLPYWFQVDDSCSAAQHQMAKTLVVAVAGKVWEKVLHPTTGFRPQLWGYHQVKMAALLGLTIPAKYTHIIVDESHDLSPPMLQILDASPQTCVSLGDCYQNLEGVQNHRLLNVHERTMTHSFRTGKALNDLLNPLILSHPFNVKDPFYGDPEIHAVVDYYKKAVVPDAPTCILVADEWGWLEWILRVTGKGKKFCVIGDIDPLDQFVTNIIDLKEQGKRPSHWGIARFASWDSLCAHFDQLNNRGFRRVFDVLGRGFSHRDWAATKGKQIPLARGEYVVDMAKRARNYEFDRLMITPDNVDMLSASSRTKFAMSSSYLYVALTRVRYVLQVPMELRSWLEAAEHRSVHR